MLVKFIDNNFTNEYLTVDKSKLSTNFKHYRNILIVSNITFSYNDSS